MPERSDRQGVKSKDHHHTCPEAEDHHCPECCSCECCSRHSRSYETHRRYSHNRPIYPWEPDYIRPKDQYRMGGESEAEQWQRLREEREASLREDFERPRLQRMNAMLPQDLEREALYRLYETNQPIYSPPPPPPPPNMPPPIPRLRRQTQARCDECGEVREEYGVGYQCWNCGHVQQTHT